MNTRSLSLSLFRVGQVNRSENCKSFLFLITKLFPFVYGTFLCGFSHESTFIPLTLPATILLYSPYFCQAKLTPYRLVMFIVVFLLCFFRLPSLFSLSLLFYISVLATETFFISLSLSHSLAAESLAQSHQFESFILDAGTTDARR